MRRRLQRVRAAARLLGVLALASAHHASAKGFISFPPSRKMMVLEAGNRPLPNNAGGAELEFHKGHGLCGALGKDADLDVNATISPNAFFTEGDVIDVDVTLESHRKGHFEFRLCSLDANDFSQECLNEHVLKFDATFTAASYSGQMEDAMRWSPADLLENEACKSDDGTPLGSCCNHGGACTDGAHNRHRWTVPSSAAGPMYTMRLVLPRGVRCEHCVLQWFYQTGDGLGSFHGYPEGFWDCADITIARKEDLPDSIEAGQMKRRLTFEDQFARRRTETGCWSAVGDDHTFCRTYKCRQNYINDGLCTTDNPYDEQESSEAPTASPTADSTSEGNGSEGENSQGPTSPPLTPAPTIEHNSTENNGEQEESGVPTPAPTLAGKVNDEDSGKNSDQDEEDFESDDRQDSSKSMILGASAAAVGAVAVAASVFYVYRNKHTHVREALPVAMHAVDVNDDDAPPKSGALGKLRRSLFRTPRSDAQNVFMAKEVEAVVVASPVP